MTFVLIADVADYVIKIPSPEKYWVIFGKQSRLDSTPSRDTAVRTAFVPSPTLAVSSITRLVRWNQGSVSRIDVD